ncbi:uncharacterized protein ACR2FA_012672 [Aphomia sociella]
METSSYLFMSKRKRYNFSSRIMEKHSSSDSNISLDSLEADFKEKATLKDEVSSENVDTILVPFYEKDVLIKIPKGQTRKQKQENDSNTKKETRLSNYPVNKDRDNRKSRRGSYLEMFRKQFSANGNESKNNDQEIRSISPEVGDTERESIDEGINNPVSEFYNTECYNEIYYDRLLNQEINNYLDNSFEDELRLPDNIKSKPPQRTGDDNFKSISEVSQPRRRLRRATVEPINNMKLGGLGPDMEKIKPRLERARSLQRYSEKVRMENRLKIYKKSVQEDIERKAEKDLSGKRQCIEMSKDYNISYLVNKSPPEKVSKITRQIYHSKSKSAGAQKTRERCKEKLQLKEKLKSDNRLRENEKQKSVFQETRSRKPLKTEKDSDKTTNDIDTKVRVKSSGRSKGVNTEIGAINLHPPVHISFLVDVRGVQASSALKQLEEKHKMYQEQIKAFITGKNN